MRTIRFGMFLFIAAIAGCSKAPVGPPPSPEKLEEMRRDRMKGIAEDKSIPDAEAFKKYFESSPGNPLGMPKSLGGVWAEVKPIGGGVPGSMIEIRRTDFADVVRGNKDPLVAERESIQLAVKVCTEMLDDLQARNVKGISYQLYSQVIGTEGYEEIFRATVLLKHLPKLKEVNGGAPEPGTVFDPRGPKINEIWIVQKNDYPKFTYKKN